jgi:hypothetical protein
MQKSGFFNSSGGDRQYNAADFAAYFGDLVSNGIFYRNSDNLKVLPASGMNVLVQPGSAWINGYHYQNTEPLDLLIPTANGVNPRIDRVVLRWDNLARSINLAIKTGYPSVNPWAIDLTRNDEVYELGIAEVLIPSSAMTISPGNISDTRLDPYLCGLVNSLITAVYE